MAAEPARKVSSTIQLEARDTRGKRRPVRLRARLIGVRKQDVDEADQGPTSNADDEEYFRRLASSVNREIIDSPYPLKTLTLLKENSTELGQCVQTMVTNTVGFGYRLRERRMPESERKRHESEIDRERAMLSAMLETVHPVLSFTALRERQKDDQHSNGNGYLELIEDRQGRLVALNHVRSHLVRMTPREARSTRIHVPRVRPDLGFRIEQVPMWFRFRRFVLMYGRKTIWFKEAGDPRVMDKRTGKFDPATPWQWRATSLLHFPIYSAGTPYGVPRWIGNLFSIYGSRAAEEINFNTLNSNAIPSMFVIVENGALTEASIARLQEWTEEQIQRAMNYSKFLLLEGESLDEGSPNPTSFKIKVEPLKQLQQDDQLFQKYDANNRDKVRQAFRLPPIFVGRSDDYTRATADTSRDIGDEQVFAPERAQDDHLIQRFIMSRWSPRFHLFRSNTPNITDDIELIRMMAVAERSGAMTPRRANRIVEDVFGDDIGPMPTGIELDKPFSITFAEAQGGAGNPESMARGGDPAQRMVDSLVQLRERVEKEIEERWYNEYMEA